MKWEAAASYNRWHDSVITYMWEWRWNPEKETPLGALENCVALVGHAHFPLLGWEDHAVHVEEKKGPLGNDPSFSSYTLKNVHLCLRNVCVILLLLTLCWVLQYISHIEHTQQSHEKSIIISMCRGEKGLQYICTPNCITLSTKDEIWVWTYVHVT